MKHVPTDEAAAADGLDALRTDVAHRKPTPPPVHGRPVDGWTVPGSFTSRKSGWIVPYWGDLQLDFLYLAEADPSVSSIRTRPQAVEWFDGTAWREHVADFHLLVATHTVAVDVRRGSRPSGNRARSNDSLSAALLARGATYWPVYEAEIRVQPRLDNAKDVCDAGRTFDPPSVAAVDAVLDRFGECTLRTVAAETGLRHPTVLRSVLRLFFEGRAKVQVAAEITPDSIVRRI